MTFKEVLDFVRGGEYIVPTLGGKRAFQVKEEFGVLKLTNSKGTTRIVNESFFNLVWERFTQLNDNQRYDGTFYTSNNWFGPSHPRNPDTVFAPYLVALFYYVGRENIMHSDNINDFINVYGFHKIGEYYYDGEKVNRRVIEGIKIGERLDLVYAFFVDNNCMYIGKSIQGYSRPLNYHKNRVMKTVNEGVYKLVKNNKKIDILVRTNRNVIDHEGLSLSLVEPIEQALTSLYTPKWNNFIR
jgi:hypothetical protein